MTRLALAFAIALLYLGSVGCSTGVSGLQAYVNATRGYEFRYPNGWVEVTVDSGSSEIDLVLRDFVERTENLSVAIGDVAPGKTLAALGSPSEVGYRLLKNAIAPAGADRKADLVGAELGNVGTQTYYRLEYAVTLPSGQQRHNLASVAVSHDKLFTFNVSVPERRWQRLSAVYEAMVDSFRVY
ncbi:PsbP [Rubidibacter lacunae KORDI 51-2]|uniref:PsbP n=1 Tax=Rubidibacter lacunae KORDI 51-2 TaxID=582515 RepID=U5DJD2_9CHRO|nr:photosystem II reaction center PsbP [Rubidibacter lacunae]ERN41801.1 PsbP [Rubidibacter lacunae KORDI 51-2]